MEKLKEISNDFGNRINIINFETEKEINMLKATINEL